MPLYEYECDSCGHRFEVIQKFSDALADKCPKCGSTVHKLFSSPAIQFKGSGWYITDYAKKDSAAAGKSGSKDEATASKDGAGSTDNASKGTDSGSKGTDGSKGTGASKGSDSAPAAATSTPAASAPASVSKPD
jgi:putative FmdB family regulatory protein